MSNPEATGAVGNGAVAADESVDPFCAVAALSSFAGSSFFAQPQRASPRARATTKYFAILIMIFLLVRDKRSGSGASGSFSWELSDPPLHALQALLQGADALLQLGELLALSSILRQQSCRPSGVRPSQPFDLGMQFANCVNRHEDQRSSIEVQQLSRLGICRMEFGAGRRHRVGGYRLCFLSDDADVVLIRGQSGLAIVAIPHGVELQQHRKPIGIGSDVL